MQVKRTLENTDKILREKGKRFDDKLLKIDTILHEKQEIQKSKLKAR
jgi:hypothetical protein